jgi:hypothetical protein
MVCTRKLLNIVYCVSSCLLMHMLRSSVKRQPPNVGTSEAGVKYMLSIGKAREAKCIVYIEEHAVTRYSIPIPRRPLCHQ